MACLTCSRCIVFVVRRPINLIDVGSGTKRVARLRFLCQFRADRRWRRLSVIYLLLTIGLDIIRQRKQHHHHHQSDLCQWMCSQPDPEQVASIIQCLPTLLVSNNNNNRRPDRLGRYFALASSNDSRDSGKESERDEGARATGSVVVVEMRAGDSDRVSNWEWEKLLQRHNNGCTATMSYLLLSRYLSCAPMRQAKSYLVCAIIFALDSACIYLYLPQR